MKRPGFLIKSVPKTVSLYHTEETPQGAPTCSCMKIIKFYQSRINNFVLF